MASAKYSRSAFSFRIGKQIAVDELHVASIVGNGTSVRVNAVFGSHS